MENRKIATVLAAGFIAASLTAAVADAKPRTIVVQAVDPALQRRVSYADLNLAVKPDQRTLRHRISYTAGSLCEDINGSDPQGECQRFAIASTRDQVSVAIARAERQMAGFSVGPPIAISMVIGVQ